MSERENDRPSSASDARIQTNEYSSVRRRLRTSSSTTTNSRKLTAAPSSQCDRSRSRPLDLSAEWDDDERQRNPRDGSETPPGRQGRAARESAGQPGTSATSRPFRPTKSITRLRVAGRMVIGQQANRAWTERAETGRRICHAPTGQRADAAGQRLAPEARAQTRVREAGSELRSA